MLTAITDTKSESAENERKRRMSKRVFIQTQHHRAQLKIVPKSIAKDQSLLSQNQKQPNPNPKRKRSTSVTKCFNRKLYETSHCARCHDAALRSPALKFCQPSCQQQKMTYSGRNCSDFTNGFTSRHLRTSAPRTSPSLPTNPRSYQSQQLPLVTLVHPYRNQNCHRTIYWKTTWLRRTLHSRFGTMN